MVEALNKGGESCFEQVRTGFAPFHGDTTFHCHDAPYEVEATFAPSHPVNC